jgi:hypothetical protein
MMVVTIVPYTPSDERISCGVIGCPSEEFTLRRFSYRPAIRAAHIIIAIKLTTPRIRIFTMKNKNT